MDTTSMNILLTGGTGYIGSHTAACLAQAGHTVVLLDNLSNSSAKVTSTLRSLTGRPCTFIQGDVRNTRLVTDILNTNAIEAVMHFAGLKAVKASVTQPLQYYDNNVNGTLSLLQAMQTTCVRTLVFSSSATVYGDPQQLPLTETHPYQPTNPYGRTKQYIEMLLHDLSLSDTTWKIACLRYFNPVGAHPSGRLGESPLQTPNNLFPFITQVLAGLQPELAVFGCDYNTPDGSPVRDYLHVMDLADGHIAALNFLQTKPGWHAFNLGTGQGHSVLAVIRAFEESTQLKLPYHIAPRRPGDIGCCYADCQLASQQLNWRATRTLAAMCTSAWRYQARNPRELRP